MKLKRVVAVLTLLMLAAPSVSAAEVYRWVDAEGVVQFGANPPPGVKAESMTVRASGAATAAPLPSAAASPVTQPGAATPETALQQQQEAERMRAQCANARDIVSRLRENPAASYAREDGSYQRFGDEEREQRIQEALDFQRQHCD